MATEGEDQTTAPPAGKTVGFSAEAAEFKPGRIEPYLRGGYFSQEKGWWVPYYVGTLKSFNVRTGFGFLECPETQNIYKADVYIHGSHVPTPFKIGSVVEFAVSQNSRGQPQAADCYWLPVGAQERGYDQRTPAVRAPPNSAARPRQIGILKSYSKMQGYGFIGCEDIADRHSCDVYLDRGQVAQDAQYQLGQAVEFEISYNHRGQPQARNVNWNPIPKCGGEAVAPTPSTASTPAMSILGNMEVNRPEGQQTIRNLNKILANLRSDKSSGVKSAIELQEGSGAIDYISFVLSHLGSPQTVAELPGSTPMQLLIAISSQLAMRSHTLPHEQVTQCLAWCEAIIPNLIGTENGNEELRFSHVFKVAQDNLQKAREASPQPNAYDSTLARLLETEQSGGATQHAAAAMESISRIDETSAPTESTAELSPSPAMEQPS